ncbi:MAG TPA: ABC transporter substrate-binding protein [Acidobacteriaceae bacterium]
MHRRRFLCAAASAAICTLADVACREAGTGALTMTLGWVPDVEYADLWMALDRGYIAQERLNFDYLPGGPNTPSPVTVIAAGQAAMGDADWLPLLDAVGQGNDFVVIASLFPILPVGLISLPRAPVRTVAELSGKRFLVQGPTERAMLEALFRMHGLKEDYRAVPVGFSPEPLLEGAGDAYFCFITNQPQTLAKMGMQEGKDFYVTRLYDLGYKVSTALLTTSRATIAQRRPELVRFLRALLRGHYANQHDPLAGSKLAVERYGADLGLDLEQQTALNRLQIPLETAEGTRIPFWISEQQFSGPMYQVARASGRIHLPPPGRLRDMSLLEEAYQSLPEAIRT